MKIKRDAYHLDANESAFFKRQLEFIKSKTYDTKYKSLKAITLIPVSMEVPSGSETIIYRVFSKVGVAKIVSDYANDFPRVDTYGEEKTAYVRSIGDSYGYNIKEIRRAQIAGLNLNQRRADIARRAQEELVDDIAWNGDKNYKLQGLINYPGIIDYTVPNDGTASSKLWTAKTPDQIVRDVSGLITAVVDVTNGIEAPDTLILPISKYMILVNTRMTDGNDKNILSYIKENNPFLKTIEWVNELKTAGGSATARMMAYTKAPTHLTLEIPQPFEQMEPQQEGMEYVVPCHSECGGVIVYYPLSVVFGDGI